MVHMRAQGRSRAAWSRCGGCAAAVALGLLAVGCPSGPTLSVSPGALNFGTTDERASFSILNTGAGDLNWSVGEAVWDPVAKQWVDEDVPWLSIDPSKVSGVSSGQTDWVALHVTRTGLAEGVYVGIGVRVTSNGGGAVIPVSMTVSGSTGPGPGQGKIQVTPDAVKINGLADTATFTVSNEGNALIQWYTDVRINAAQIPSGAVVQLAASPTTAATAPNATTTVIVGISDPTQFNASLLNYTVLIKNRADNAVLAQVAVTIELIGPPAIYVDPATLDFGKDGFQLSFLVANSGDPFSILDFAVFSPVAGAAGLYAPYDVTGDPLIAAIVAPKGTTGIKGDPNNPLLNAREVSVTISRDGIEQDIEYRELWIGKVKGTNAEGQPIIDLDTLPQKVQVRVEASPSIEGATNRSRPPSLTRFVFLLRDKRGIATDASDPLSRNQIKFYVEEDKFPLDPDESSQFVTGPDELKVNLVLLLDFTGSMFFAGVDSAQNPLAPGEAIGQMVAAAKQFVLDLPESYSVALMEYHDVNQPSRVIHGFDTNKASLLEALDRYTVPVGEHGASAVYDALYDAAQRLVQQDPGLTLPFDDADVRAVVFVSDGWDTSSIRKVDELKKYAEDNQVRFYPVGFSGRITNPVNGSVLIPLAADSGGHSYYASEVGDLAKLLDTNKGLSFGTATADLDQGTAVLQIRNIGSTALTWRAIENLGWLTVYPGSGVIPPLHRKTDGTIDETGIREATIRIASGLPAGDYAGSIAMQSDSGDADVNVQAAIAGGVVSDLRIMPHTIEPGRIWKELRGQIVLTYTSLFQEGNHLYLVQASFPDAEGKATSAAFEKDAIYYPGDVRAGQVSLRTAGIQDGVAEVFLRADYLPRDINQFRVRFLVDVPPSLTPNLTVAERALLAASLQSQLNGDAVEIPSEGLLTGWRLINVEGDGIFSIITEPDAYLPFGSFGNLLKATFAGLRPTDAFTLGLRVDNQLYYKPASATGPSLTKYFEYPGGRLNPDGLLTVTTQSNAAYPSTSIGAFQLPFDPEAAGAWDRDNDGVPDFDDPAPDNQKIP